MKQIKNKINTLLIFALILFANAACRQRPTPPQPNFEREKREILAEYNKQLVEKELNEIESFCKQSGKSFEKHQFGFYYAAEKQSTENPITDKTKIGVIMDVFLLDSTLCYSYTLQQPYTIVVGNNDFQGMNIAVKLLGFSGVGSFVFPHYMAFGLFGDGDKIPPALPILCDIKNIIKIN